MQIKLKFQSSHRYDVGMRSSLPALLRSLFQVVHIPFYSSLNVGHLVVLSCIYSSCGSQQHTQNC